VTAYLDYAATTPLDPEVLAAINPYFGTHFANPASWHRSGQQARRAVEAAREQVAALLGAKPREVTFTSGATEAINHALRAVAELYPGGQIVTSQLEHAAVLTTCRWLERRGLRVTYLAPNHRGEITPAAVAAALSPDTVLVALMLVNNETGVVTAIPAISRLAHEAGALLLCDAVQAAAYLPVEVAPLGADLLALSGHKLYGPKGVGVLYVREGLELPPLLLGGAQERGMRAGTLNVPAIVGMGAACRLAIARREADAAQVAVLRDELEAALLALDGVTVNGAGAPRSPQHLMVSVAGADGEALLIALDQLGVSVSAGSACAAGALTPSHVLLAMGLTPAAAKASLRFSLGRMTRRDEIDHAARSLRQAIARCRI